MGEVLSGEQQDRQTDALPPAIIPRPYQLDALEAIRAHRASGEQRGLVTMATGLGKTLVGALDIDAFLDEDPSAKILFLTHRNEIINQAWGRFGLLLAHREDIDYHYLQPRNMPPDLEDKRFVFASFQMMHNGRHQGGDVRTLFARDHFSYVLTDEAHHSSAPTFLPTLKYFEARYSLGLTATPDRADTRNIRYFYGREIYRKTLPDGIAEGHLAQPHYVGIAPKVTVKMIEEGGAEKEIEANVDRATVIEIVKDIQERTAHINDPKIIVYAHNIEEAELYAEFMPNARAIHSQVSQDERTDMLDDFRVTRPSTLTSVDVLNEGIDVPDVDVIVMARSTGSEAVFLQQLGRGLRRSPGKESVLILDYVANSERLLMVARLMAGISKNVEKEEKPRTRRAPARLHEIIDAPEIDLENAVFEFDESILDIIAILKEREALNERIASQTAEKSVEEYLELCKTHHHILSRKALNEILGVNHVELLLRPFDGSIMMLRRAADILSVEDNRNLVTISGIARAYDIPLAKVALAVKRNGIIVKMAQSKRGPMARAVDSSYIPIILQSVAGERLPDGPQPPLDGEIRLVDAIELIAPGTPSKAFALALNELDIPHYRRLYVADGRRKVSHTFDGGELGSVEDYLETLPVADYHSKSIEDIARFTETEPAEAYKAAEHMGIEGECRRSPSTGIVHVYLDPHDVARLISDLTWAK